MSFLSKLASPFAKVVDKVESIVPSSWVTKYGQLAHTYAANILHDFDSAVAAGFTEFKTLSQPILLQIESAIEEEALTVGKSVLAGTPLTDAVATGVKSLVSAEVVSVVPAMKVVGEATLTTILRSIGASAVATLAVSPTAPLASSSAASSSAPAKH